MSDQEPRSATEAFRPRARLLQILGDQLIGSPRLAVFELVKNAYDADASKVTVRILDLEAGSTRIEVKDDGSGMSFETIRDIWLVPADDHRERQRAEGRRSPKYHRLPLGEKGVGRFAVHKLGEWIELVTRAAGQKECVVRIDWRELMRNRLLEDALVTVTERDPEVFTGDRTGTRIRIKDLREPEWTRRDLRELWRQLTSITSPFRDRDDVFEIKLKAPDRRDWLEDLPDARALMKQAPWRFTFSFDGNRVDWNYEFRGLAGSAIEARTACGNEHLQVLAPAQPDDLDPADIRPRRRLTKVVADQSTLSGIGPVSGTFHIWDRDKATMSQYPNTRLIERFLDQNGGVRVYRDDIRVYNYGEEDDDWLGLDIRRVNVPTRNISRNIVVGAVDLQLSQSTELREKTNREGFVLNDAYQRLKQVVLGAVAIAETERQKDKVKMRQRIGAAPTGPKGITKPIEQLRRQARKHGVADQLEPSIRRIERDYDELRDSFLRAGMSNVGLAVVFHEVERGVAVLHRTITSGGSVEQVRSQSGQLQAVLEQSTRLLRKNERDVHKLRDLVVGARDLLLPRFRHHRIRLDCPVLHDESNEVKGVFAFNLALGALTNLIDNAIHWLKVAHPEESGEERRSIYLDVVADWDGQPAIVIADNGTGFRDSPEEVVQPFFSRRPDGMGLGLYYANMVMQINDGRLDLLPASEIDAPEGFDGAAAALVFKGVG
ncbi:MAG TPA: ATP-binding protein [Allosphingosinicella sp.]